MSQTACGILSVSSEQLDGIHTSTDEQYRIFAWIDDLQSCTETESVTLHLPDTGPARIEIVGHAIDGYVITRMLTCHWDNRLVSCYTDGSHRTHCSVSIDPDHLDPDTWTSCPVFMGGI